MRCTEDYARVRRKYFNLEIDDDRVKCRWCKHLYMRREKEARKDQWGRYKRYEFVTPSCRVDDAYVDYDRYRRCFDWEMRDDKD